MLKLKKKKIRVIYSGNAFRSVTAVAMRGMRPCGGPFVEAEPALSLMRGFARAMMKGESRRPLGGYK
jgi:hypothetical protein